MFFAKQGVYKPCGMYTKGHLILLVITVISIITLLICTRKSNKNQIYKIIRKCIITLWILEIIKIVFNLAIGNSKNPNHYLPLYYCSMILYAGLFSLSKKEHLKRVGEIFIATGSIVGGIFFLCCPNTSITMYPLFHYISIQSFIFHGTMVYLGLLVNVTKYVEWKYKDIKYYAELLAVMLIVSYFVNKVLGTNFMFISQNFPGTPVDIIYKGTGKYFTIVMSLLQITLPFIWVHIARGIIRFIHRTLYIVCGKPVKKDINESENKNSEENKDKELVHNNSNT